MDIGASFSHRQLEWMGHDSQIALSEFIHLGFRWVRLGCYWDEIEEIQGDYNFSRLDPLLENCAKSGLPVVMTIGMKAPRWPEYYFPSFLMKEISFKPHQEIESNNIKLVNFLRRYIEACVKHLQKFDIIQVWQIENEPLDPSGEFGWHISPELLNLEIDWVRQMDKSRKILVNLWGNELSKRGFLNQIVSIVDGVGFDFYPMVPVEGLGSLFNKYSGVDDSDTKLERIIKKIKLEAKEVWITELQAEPWEVGDPATKKSFLPSQFELNLKWGKSLRPDKILLWGFEYWYDQKLKENPVYWDKAKLLLVSG